MRKLSAYFLFFMLSMGLTACSSTLNPFAEENTTTPSTKPMTLAEATPHVPESEMSGAPVGGFIQSSMDENDKSKMWHALDNAVGKPTHWVNDRTKIDYTVVPTSKLTIAGNPFCRRYTVSAVKGTKNESVNGTACVGDDSNWKAVRG